MGKKKSFGAYLSEETLRVIDTYASVSRKNRNQAIEDLVQFAIVGYAAFPEEEHMSARILIDATRKRIAQGKQR